MIKIGTVLHLELIPDEKDKDKNKVIKYKCKLVDKAEDQLIIDQPINEETGRNGYFYEGTEFNLWFVGNDGAIYSFQTQLLGRKRANINMYVLEDPGKENYMRTQRRNFVRVEATTDVAIHPHSDKFKPFRTYTLDISGGGMLIIIPKDYQLPKEGELTCYIALPMHSGDIYYVKTICKIVRIFQKENHALPLASLQIIDVKEREQERIIRYCFENEVIAKKK